MSRSRTDTENNRVVDAAARLESAVNDLVASASDSATVYVERAAEQLKRQAALRRARGYRQAEHREPSWLWSDKRRSRKLYRYAGGSRIFGVCAGIANYYGIETWVVRCIAATGLIFLPGVVLPGYLIAAFILDKEPADEAAERVESDGDSEARSASRERLSKDAKALRDGSPPAVAKNHDAPKETLPLRQHLGRVRIDLEDIEQRLRRLESHVTSGQYELQRELGKIRKA